MGIRILRRKSRLNVDKASTSTDDQSTNNTEENTSSSTSSKPETSSSAEIEYFTGQKSLQNHIKKSKPSVIVELSAKLSTLEFFVGTLSKKSKINLYSFSNVPGDYETEEKYLGGLSNASVKERIHVFNKFYIHVVPEDYGDNIVDLLFVGDNIAFKNLKIIWDNFTPNFNKKSTAVFLTEGNKNIEAFVNIVLSDDNNWKILRSEGVAFVSRNTSRRKPKNPIPIVIHEVKELASSLQKSVSKVSTTTKDSADEVSRSAQVSADQATASAQDSVDEATTSAKEASSKTQTRAEKSAARAQAKADKAKAQAQAKADKAKAKAQAKADKAQAKAEETEDKAPTRAQEAVAKAQKRAEETEAKEKTTQQEH